MQRTQDMAIEAMMEQLIANGSEDMASVFAGLFDLAMRIERERFLGAEHYERTPLRHGYANGTKPKRLDTPAGTVTVRVPKTAGHDEPFYPQSLERGRRSTRAVMLAVAEMYVKGPSSCADWNGRLANTCKATTQFGVCAHPAPRRVWRGVPVVAGRAITRTRPTTENGAPCVTCCPTVSGRG